MMWHSIESAPRDKTILVYGIWAGEINGVSSKPGIYIATWTKSSDYYDFNWSVEGTDAYAAWVKPSHWMLLPEGP